MTTTPPPANPGQPPSHPTGSGFFESIRRSGFWRSQDRWLGGVAGGLAAKLGWDPLLVRGLVILLSLLTGGGVLAIYGVAWLLLPEAADGRIHFEQVLRGRWSAGFWGGMIATFIGLTSGAGWSSFTRGYGFFFSLVLLVGLVIAIVAIASNRQGQPAPWTQPTQPMPNTASGMAPSPTASFDPSTGAPGQVPVDSTGPTASATTGAWAPAAAGGATYGPQGGAYAKASADAATGSANSATFDASRPPAPPRAQPGRTAPQPPAWTTPNPRRRRAGGPVTMALVGLMAILIAVMVAVDRYTDRFDRWLTPGLAIGVAMVFMGLGLVILGLLGRRAGSFLAVSIVLVVLAAPIVAFADATRAGGGHLVVGERNHTPTQMSQIAKPFGMSMGQITVDLTKLNIPNDQVAVVDVNLSMGQANVIVPSQTPIMIEASIDAGDMNLSGLSNGWQISDVSGHKASVTSPRRAGPGTTATEEVSGLGVNITAISPGAMEQEPQIIVTVNATIGQVVLSEQPSRVS
ncbi:MAG: PspC domain-containing protein [Micrococcales bacterium]|nr:PspC domain-containing protein [Micrococcales bacterium]